MARRGGAGKRKYKAGERFDAAKRAAIAAEMYADGKTHAEIGTALGIDRSVVSRLLAKVKTEWEERAVSEIERGKRKAIEELDKVLANQWAAYTKSLGSKVVKRQQQTMIRGKNGDLSPVTAEGQEVVLAVQTEERPEGDVRILDNIRKSIETRARILGVLKMDPNKVVDVPTVPDPSSEIVQSSSQNQNVLVIRIGQRAPAAAIPVESRRVDHR